METKAFDLNASEILSRKELDEALHEWNYDYETYDYEAIMICGKQKMEKTFRVIGVYAVAELQEDVYLIFYIKANPQIQLLNTKKIMEFSLN